MKHLLTAAVLTLASTSAYAQNSVSFDIDGRRVQIGATRGCNALSCVSVSIPGVFETGQKGRFGTRIDDGAAEAVTVAPSPALERPVRTPAAPEGTTANGQPLPAYQGTPPAGAAVTPPAPNAPPVATEVVRPAPSAPAAAVPPAPLARQQVANLTQNPVSTATPAPQPVGSPPSPAPDVRAEPSPLGIWKNEDNKGLVRIEACGRNLCGYAVSDGEKVLDLKPLASARWGGKIYDPSSGNTYDSTVTLKSGGTARVQGCTFGGMLCGSQTWIRVG